MNVAEETLAAQLTQAGIPFEREYRFAPPRRWRFDFARPAYDERQISNWFVHHPAIAIEVEGGSWTGGHKRGKAYESDCEKQNAAMMLGWQIFRFTPAMVEDGRALEVIRQALGLAAAS